MTPEQKEWLFNASHTSKISFSSEDKNLHMNEHTFYDLCERTLMATRILSDSTGLLVMARFSHQKVIDLVKSMLEAIIKDADETYGLVVDPHKPTPKAKKSKSETPREEKN